MATIAVPLISAGISALSGLFGGKNKQTQEQSGTSSSTTNTSGTTTSGVQLSPAYQTFINNLLNNYSSINQPVNMSGYRVGQVQGINRASNLSQQALNNTLAAKGLSNSPAAIAASRQNDADRVSNIVSMNQQIPLLENQLNLQNLSASKDMGSLLASLSPTTTTSSGTTSSSGTTTGSSTGTDSSGGGLGGLFNMLASIMAANSGQSGTGTGLTKILTGLFGGG